MRTTSRRNFFKTSSLLGGGLSFLGFNVLPDQLLAQASGAGLPFYKPGAPFSENISPHKDAALVLQGTVYQHNGKAPLAGATVELWQCNELGVFDFSNQYFYRGKTTTDQRGRYQIHTDFPGRYEENGRPKMSRIFVLVNGPGHQESFAPLYFDSNKNPYIDKAHWEASPLAERPTLPRLLATKGKKVVQYNHYLHPSPLQAVALAESAAGQFRSVANHRLHQSFVSFGKLKPGLVSVQLTAPTGQMLRRNTYKDVQPGQLLEVRNEPLPAGYYICSVYSSRYGGFSRRLFIS